MEKQSAVIEHKSYARVGLLGNPSDVYFGNTISFSLGNFWASVRLEPSTDLVIVPHPSHDLVQFNSIYHLVLYLMLFPSESLLYWWVKYFGIIELEMVALVLSLLCYHNCSKLMMSYI